MSSNLGLNPVSCPSFQSAMLNILHAELSVLHTEPKKKPCCTGQKSKTHFWFVQSCGKTIRWVIIRETYLVLYVLAARCSQLSASYSVSDKSTSLFDSP